MEAKLLAKATMVLYYARLRHGVGLIFPILSLFYCRGAFA